MLYEKQTRGSYVPWLFKMECLEVQSTFQPNCKYSPAQWQMYIVFCIQTEVGIQLP